MSNGDYLYGENGEDQKVPTLIINKALRYYNGLPIKNNPGVINQIQKHCLIWVLAKRMPSFLALGLKRCRKSSWRQNGGRCLQPLILAMEKQMKAFLGVRSFAVNQQTQAPLAAMTLANYLTSEKAQMTYFKRNRFCPFKQKLQTNEEITQDTVAKAILEMAQPTHSVVMPKSQKSFHSGLRWMQ